MSTTPEARANRPAGGTFSREILKGLAGVSPTRAAARIGAMGASSIIIPKMTETPTAWWGDEGEELSETEEKYGQVEIVAQA